MSAWLEGLRVAFAHAWLVRAVGWTLVHFCWQGAVVAAVLWCALELAGGRPARLRYAIACGALGLMAVLPLVTLARVGPAEYRRASTTGDIASPAQTMRVGVDDADTEWTARAVAMLARELDPAMPWVMVTWFAGACLFVLRLGAGFAVTRRMRRVGVWAVNEELHARFAVLARRLGLHKAVRLMHSAMVEAPTVIGWLRPVVLLPVSCLTGLTEMQLEAVLCHELAHVLRQDYLVSVVQSAVEALLFYHPGVWWVSRQVRRERECCCDEIAVAVGGDRLAYARALTLLETRRGSYPQVLLGANGGVLTMRIKRMLGAGEQTAAGQVAAVVVLAMLAAGAVSIGSAARAETRQQSTAVAEPAPVVVAPVAPAKVAVAPMQAKARVSRAEVERAPVLTMAAAASPGEIGGQEPQGPPKVSGGIMAGQVVSKVTPVYPAEAKAEGIQGAVVLRAIISKTGEVLELQVVSGPKELTTSALEAVRQWKYQPFLLNGEPTEVETTITVNYALAR